MEILATETEQLIKDTAKKVFFTEGRLRATTQDIADAAGINRASIHYYFRSRQLLFNKVFIEANNEMKEKLDAVFEEESSLKVKVKKFVEIFIEKSLKHPYLELFIVTEFNSYPDMKFHMTPPDTAAERMAKLNKELQVEIKAGTIKPITPHQFIITLISLCSYPFIGRPLVKHFLDLNDEAYNKLMIERKAVIMRLLFLDEY